METFIGIVCGLTIVYFVSTGIHSCEQRWDREIKIKRLEAPQKCIDKCWPNKAIFEPDTIEQKCSCELNSSK